MIKIVINCKDTDERRIYENCQPLAESLPWIQEKVGLFDGDWQYLNHLLYITIPSNENFRELTALIEFTIADNWIIIDTGTRIMSVFSKTPSLSEKWEDIAFHARLYGAEVHGNILAFKKNSNSSASNSASAFVNRFCSLFIH